MNDFHCCTDGCCPENQQLKQDVYDINEKLVVFVRMVSESKDSPFSFQAKQLLADIESSK